MSGPNLNTFSPTHSVESLFAPLPSFKKSDRVCIVGAGAFGGWTALHLLRKGFQVTLIDAWGAGNSRSSSGDETRVIRSTYGSNELYFRLNVRSLELWKEAETQLQKKIFYNTGVLWLCYHDDNPVIDDSIPFTEKYDARYERLSAAVLQKNYPLINTSDLHGGFFDPYGGYLKAREACQAVLEAFVREGGNFLQHLAIPGPIKDHQLKNVRLENGTEVNADVFVFACGSWLPFIFPEVLSRHLHCTKQEVYYFGVPSQHAGAFDALPVWVDLDGENFYYGIAGNTSRGFKIGLDKRGPIFNPTSGDRTLDPDVLAEARKFLAHRFPALKDAPLVENRVCPYENSTTGNFIFDVHPETNNLFFLGGGSGHGFKHGPALGELVAGCIDATQTVPDLFRVAF